jgi:hypothetical protein
MRSWLNQHTHINRDQVQRHDSGEVAHGHRPRVIRTGGTLKLHLRKPKMSGRGKDALDRLSVLPSISASTDC